MSRSRSYDESCAVAHSLDLIGERWALLVVRELLLGPKRFTDLRAGLPNASPNVLAQRLRELERAGVVQRRRLALPARSWVYELTDWGYELEQVLVQLGRWGSRSGLPREGRPGVDALLLAIRTLFDRERAADLDATYALLLDDDAFAIRVTGGEIAIRRGDAIEPDVTVTSDVTTLRDVLRRRVGPRDAQAGGKLTVTGRKRLFERLVEAVTIPEAASTPRSHPVGGRS
jgi:DNA-binding HxlR family transcriptional regulator/putative sterol carrier protein